MATNNSINVGTSATGTILQGAGVGTAPTWSTATYPSASVGTGKILYDNGTNFITSTPTFPASASATSRKIIVSDGTNWTASTETWATPGAANNVLTSDGTNWTSAAPAGPSGLTYVSLNINSAQVKALHATPIQIIAAQGSGKVIIPFSAQGKLIYGGSNVFTAGASQAVDIWYDNTLTNKAMSQGLTNAALIGSASSYTIGSVIGFFGNIAITSVENKGIYLGNSNATEISGNVAGNNTVTISILYYVISI